MHVERNVCVGTKKTPDALRRTSCGYVWHVYASGGNELQDLFHVLPALLFVLRSNMDPVQRFPCCHCE